MPFRLLKQAMKWAVAQSLITAHTLQQLRAMHAQSRRQMAEFGLAGDPYIPGTQEPESRPHNPTQLGKDFAAFCKMNGFLRTFHAASVKRVCPLARP